MITKIKNFFRTIFMCDNPTKGVMFSLSFLWMAVWLLPLYMYFVIMPLLVNLPISISSVWSAIVEADGAELVNLAISLSSLILRALPYLVIFLYGIIVYCIGVAKLVKSYSLNRLICGIILILSIFILIILQFSAKVAIYAPPAIILLLVMIARTNKEDKFSWLFAYPLLIIAITWGGAHLYKYNLLKQVAEQRSELSGILNRSVELGDYRQRAMEGISIDDEPLKTLLVDFDSKAPTEEEIIALNQLLELPVGKVAHDISDIDNLGMMLLPEIGTFRELARYVAGEIIANPYDKVSVKKGNDDLIKLRDWMLNTSNTLIGALVTKSIEAIRLDALSYALATGEYTKAEFEQLVGNAIDWRELFALSYGDEASCHESIFLLLYNGKLAEIGSKNLQYFENFMPVFVKIYLLKDYSFALNHYQKLVEAMRTNRPEIAELEKNRYLLSSLMLPALEGLVKTATTTEETRVMATLAYDIMEQYKLTGELPTTMELPLTPNGKEIFYKSGDIVDNECEEFYGFCLYTENNKNNTSFNVRLTKEQ